MIELLGHPSDVVRPSVEMRASDTGLQSPHFERAGFGAVPRSRFRRLPLSTWVIGNGEVLNLLGNWRGASFADVIQRTGFGEPAKEHPMVTRIPDGGRGFLPQMS